MKKHVDVCICPPSNRSHKKWLRYVDCHWLAPIQVAILRRCAKEDDEETCRLILLSLEQAVNKKYQRALLD